MKIKRYIYIVVLCLISIGIQAQVNSSPSTSKNYIHTIVPQSNQGVSGPIMESITYVDGLGRTDQVIQVGASPNGKDLVQPVVYDAFGRESKKYLPYAGSGSTGAYYTNETQVSNWSQHYGIAEDDFAYSETVFENSPLNRVLVQGAAGADWQPTYSSGIPSFSGHTVKLEYATNTSTEVLNFDVNNITKTSNIYYGASQLYKTVTKDENWTSGKAHTTEEFKDKQGLVVLKRSWLNEGTEVNTYYVYDDFGLLRYVLPPKAFESGSTTITSTELAQLCYQYEYDHRKRMIKKVLPGALPVYLVYDERDRLVATQDGNMRNRKDAQNNPDPCWMFTKYDVLNRPVMTGLYASSKDQSNLQSEVNNTTTYPVASMFEEKGVSLYSYTNRSFPKNITSTDVLTVAYYDDYSASSDWGYAYSEPLGFSANTQAVSVKGMVTASQTKNLETGTWMREVFYYDKYGRLLQSYKKNDLGGYDRITNLYDFTGTLIKTEQYHRRLSSSTPIIISQRFEYDHAKRLTKAYHKIGNQSEVLMVENKYDELGQLIEKNLHNNIQSVDYRYNIRGWLTSINNANLSNDGSLNNDSNDLFGMELSYNEYVSGLSSTSDEQFNGNISAMKWKNSSHSSVQAYLFSYDVLNRLKKADYKYNSGSWVNSSAYDVSGSSVYGNQIAYDLNGNILSLYRNNGSGSAIDKLAYQYTGNQLRSVEDAAGNDGFKELVSNSIEYTFDDNGNLIDDDNRGHEIQYNLLNLPKSLNGGALQYQYSATGEKLRKIFGSTTTDYIGNFVYVNNALAYIITSEGRIVKPGTTYLYEYNLKDHLGNTRTSFQANGSIPTVLQNQDYYPFGMAMNTIQNDNRYLYNGKELQDDVINGDNLDWLDYGARMYDAALGRWHVIDSKLELYKSQSPYNYCTNNPIRFLDRKGETPWDVVEKARSLKGTWYDFGGKNTYYPAGVGVDKSSARKASLMHRFSYDKHVSETGKAGFYYNKKLTHALYQIKVPDGYSLGLDCSGLAGTAFNADPDKMMDDFDLNTMRAVDMKNAFKKAEKTGKGLLHNDFSQLVAGDLIFYTASSGFVHVYVATGEKEVLANGKYRLKLIHTNESGTQAGEVTRTMNSRYSIGHTNRTTDYITDTNVEMNKGMSWQAFWQYVNRNGLWDKLK
ncbi:DUF6443 domain-containing protein [Marinifilum fragile]|uniref:DUF6443 domain-containing protein n=1 Tax=Marinifilum fragile TaxID=570161 RepID=UPI002AA7738F|nr:DUF6443 domain-containing protein [Marinifilum fragile]